MKTTCLVEHDEVKIHLLPPPPVFSGDGHHHQCRTLRAANHLQLPLVPSAQHSRYRLKMASLFNADTEWLMVFFFYHMEFDGNLIRQHDEVFLR